MTLFETKALDAASVERLLRGVPRRDFAVERDEDFRISLAGAQEKTALTRHRGRWCVPLGSTPTTHIFKLPLGLVGGRGLDLSNAIDNEWLCSRLLEAFGLPVARSELLQFGEVRTLVVERFDRSLHPSKAYWLRLPQEDFCQATGRPSSAKYEADGGPGIVEIAGILASSDTRDADLATLLRAQLLFWMLAHRRPCQELLHSAAARRPLSVDPVVRRPLGLVRRGQEGQSAAREEAEARNGAPGQAQALRGNEIRREHFNGTARACGLGPDMNDLIDQTVEATPQVVERVGSALPAGFPANVFDAISAGLKRASRQLGLRRA